MLKPKLIELIKRIDAEEQALFTRLSKEERSAQGKPDRWSPKDEIAHIAAWKERAVENLAAAARGEAPTRYDDFEQVNARDFETYRNKSWEEILEKAAEANRQMIAQIEERSESELGQVYFEERKVWRTIVGNGYTHPIIHLAQIYVNRGDTAYATELQESAARELAKLDESQSWQGTVTYNLACHYALIGEKEKAIEGLKKALDLNPELTEWSKEDPDLTSIREEPECLALYEE